MKQFIVENKNTKEKYTVLALSGCDDNCETEYLLADNKTGNLTNIRAQALCQYFKFKGFI